MPLDQTTTEATEVREHIESAACWLFRSMEAEGSLLRQHCCSMAANELLCATALADDDERRILAGHYRIAQSLAEQFYGDGMGVSKLLDELQTMTEAQ